ncbi:MAG TPA: Hsp33 family molecular chaperone HslO [Bacillota bacterium]|jgi:molecular chaperone Hsp33|nr:Hsp33 family molecular chaperone HslO [Bacillota bacterium]HOL10655.1 Hsp33 family molecular chaperone HslO [Bacillota bacterium]HPO98058.1 Hsp33 family molecular chaperone HslO [Bacillota bacterium]
MKDQLIIATAFEGTVRIYAATTTAIVEEARRIHNTWPTATAALGRTLTGTLIMGVMYDPLHRLTVRLVGDGPVGEILAVSNQRGTVKGDIVQPQVDLELNQFGKLDVAGAVGSGELIVLKDIGLKEPYQGVVPIVSGEIAEDFAYYFTKSEQTPSAVALGVLVNPDGGVRVAGGLIVQLMPGVTEETTSYLENCLSKMPPITTVLESGKGLTDLIAEVLGPIEVNLLEEIDVNYYCDCSYDKFKGPLLSLGDAELDAILQQQGCIEVKCHFCHQQYQYRKADLE